MVLVATGSHRIKSASEPTAMRPSSHKNTITLTHNFKITSLLNSPKGLTKCNAARDVENAKEMAQQERETECAQKQYSH